MEPTNLNPEAIRKISLRLYGAEKFYADPATVILDTIAWVDAVLGNSEPQLSGKPIQNDLVRQLTDLVNRKGVTNVAAELEVSTAALRSWLHGVTPTEANRRKIEALLRAGETSPIDAAAEPLKAGELFGQPQLPEPESTESSPA